MTMRVSSPVADLRRSKSRRPEGFEKDPDQETQLLCNERVRLLEVDGEWTYIEACEQKKYYPEAGWSGYKGWIQREALAECVEVDVREVSKKFLGVPYLWGGMSQEGIDCSGLTHLVYREMGIEIPRDACDQYRSCEKIELDNLECGDLIFSAPEGKGIDHVILYLGNGQVMEARMSKGCVYESSLEERLAEPDDCVFSFGRVLGVQ